MSSFCCKLIESTYFGINGDISTTNNTQNNPIEQLKKLEINENIDTQTAIIESPINSLMRLNSQKTIVAVDALANEIEANEESAKMLLLTEEFTNSIKIR